MSKKKYIPDNSWLTCDKGANPIKIKVTHNNNSYLYGEKLVSEMDMVPGENVDSFGSCSLCGSCAFDPVYWDKCNQGVKVNSYKLVFEDANLLCKKGGKIKVDFTVPASMKNGESDFFAGWTPLGGATANAMPWLNYKDVIDYNQRGVIYDVENGKISLNQGNDQRLKANYGEMKDNVYHREQGWRDIRSKPPEMNINAPMEHGIDGAYNKGDIYKTTDGKYGTSRLGNTNNGKQLSQSWVDNHIRNSGINSRDAEAMRRANNNGTLQREVIYTDKNEAGRIREGLSSETHNNNGNKATRGQYETLEMKPTSKANNLINSARSSVRNSKPIQSLANSSLSKAVQSSTAANKANNALWKATQFVEAKPVLSTTGKVVGRGLIVVGIALEGYNVYETYQQEGGFGTETKKATGGAVGSVALGWAGAEVGAIIGTAICPGVGTVIGGVVGGAIGAIAGSSVGKWIGSWF